MLMNAMNTYEGDLGSDFHSIDQYQASPMSSFGHRDVSTQPTTFHLTETFRNSGGEDAFDELLHRTQLRHQIDTVSMPTETDDHQRRVHGETPCRMDCWARGSALSRVGRRLTLTFSADQIDCVCHVLSRAKNIIKLDAFLRQLTGEELERNTEELCKVNKSSTMNHVVHRMFILFI